MYHAIWRQYHHVEHENKIGFRNIGGSGNATVERSKQGRLSMKALEEEEKHNVIREEHTSGAESRMLNPRPPTHSTWVPAKIARTLANNTISANYAHLLLTLDIVKMVITTIKSIFNESSGLVSTFFEDNSSRKGFTGSEFVEISVDVISGFVLNLAVPELIMYPSDRLRCLLNRINNLIRRGIKTSPPPITPSRRSSRRTIAYNMTRFTATITTLDILTSSTTTTNACTTATTRVNLCTSILSGRERLHCRDTDLVKRTGAATAAEVRPTGLSHAFATYIADLPTGIGAMKKDGGELFLDLSHCLQLHSLAWQTSENSSLTALHKSQKTCSSRMAVDSRMRPEDVTITTEGGKFDRDVQVAPILKRNRLKSKNSPALCCSPLPPLPVCPRLEFNTEPLVVALNTKPIVRPVGFVLAASLQLDCFLAFTCFLLEERTGAAAAATSFEQSRLGFWKYVRCVDDDAGDRKSSTAGDMARVCTISRVKSKRTAVVPPPPPPMDGELISI
ncbi:hypothetical protein Ccrd_009443 [Cynara cardunculus var. scolymus]|uniref:Uncharacterized protein n=1 Tax=Cynara cardunculus var. scolymus TaxID=59895 RepID=A0A103YN14_CYNCS|nr:hypothetical protein Ccrd_009443 [Cynara cardunculus var. scolymus]